MAILGHCKVITAALLLLASVIFPVQPTSRKRSSIRHVRRGRYCETTKPPPHLGTETKAKDISTQSVEPRWKSAGNNLRQTDESESNNITLDTACGRAGLRSRVRRELCRRQYSYR